MPVASAIAGSLRDHLILASDTQRPMIQPLVAQCQFGSADLLLLTGGWMDDSVMTA